MTALVQAKNLHKHYASTHAVDDVSIELHQGEILGLLGPNGAGKSTCLQMLCGVLAPSEGSVLINGHDLIDTTNQAKEHIGYLPDKPPLYPELTVNEYLIYAARLRKVHKKQISSLREQAIQRCGLEDVTNRLIGNLSKGYQQRVGIAQAIIHQPKIIILDEPTVGLDPIQIHEIRKLIGELSTLLGIILSSHILPEIQAVCSRVQLIHQGKSVFNQSMASLQHIKQTVLQLEKPPHLNALEKLPGINNIERLSDNKFLLNGENIQHSLSDISKHCVENNWGLLEISSHHNSLEQVFLSLTTGDIDNGTAA